MKFFFIVIFAFTTNAYSEDCNSEDVAIKSQANLLSIAAQKYEKGELNKDQFVKIVLEINKNSENNNAINSPEKLLIKNIVPGLKYTSDPDANGKAIELIKADYLAFLKTTKVNDSKDWGSTGTLFRRAYGALYVDKDNGETIFMEDMTQADLDYQRIAQLNRSIFKFWNEKYGFQLYVPGVASLAAGESVKTDPTKYLKVLKWIKETSLSLKTGQSIKWNSMTIVKNANPGCLLILSKDGLNSSSICEKDNFDELLKGNSFLSKIASQYWDYNASLK